MAILSTEDLSFLETLVISAGEMAMEHYRKVKPTWKPDRTYITDADEQIQAYLKRALEARFPEDGIIAEEDNLRRPPRSGDRYWIVDPIDGTAAFSSGLPVWGIAVGLVAKRKPVAGFFFMPATRDFFMATPTGEVLRNGKGIRLRPAIKFNEESVLLAVSRFHRSYELAPEYPGKVRCLGSSIAHLCYAATGSADAALVGRTYIWDLAPGLAMLEHNGGVLRYLDGRPVMMGELLEGHRSPDPMIGGSPDAVREFLKLIKAK